MWHIDWRCVKHIIKSFKNTLKDHKTFGKFFNTQLLQKIILCTLGDIFLKFHCNVFTLWYWFINLPIFLLSTLITLHPTIRKIKFKILSISISVSINFMYLKHLLLTFLRVFLKYYRDHFGMFYLYIRLLIDPNRTTAINKYPVFEKSQLDN